MKEKKDILSACVISCYGRFKGYIQAEIRDMIVEHGGQCETHEWHAVKCTHMITTMADVIRYTGLMTSKIEIAALMNCSIVSLDWLLDCIRHQKQLPVDEYLLRRNNAKENATQLRPYNLRSTRKKLMDDLTDKIPEAKVPKLQVEKTFSKEVKDTDDFPGPGSEFTVWKDNHGAWDVLLMKLIHPSLVAIHRLQILQSSKTDGYYVWSYRKVNGTILPGEQEHSSRLDSVKSVFEKRFQDSTGLSWEKRQDEPKAFKFIFVGCHSKYNDGEIHTSDSKPTFLSGRDAVMKLIVPSRGQRERLLLTLAQQAHYATAASSQVAGKLECRVGMALLNQLLDHPDLVDGQSSKSEAVMNLVRAYQSLELIPQSSFTGHQDWVKKEYDQLSYQQAILSVSQKEKLVDPKWVKAHFRCHLYRTLGLSAMLQVNPSSTEYKELENYFNYSAESFYQDYPRPGISKVQIKVRNIFRIERTGEVERYNASWKKTYKKQGFQRRLLWHGSPKANFSGILHTGLNSGTRSHVFFSDFAGMSVGFCQKNTPRRNTLQRALGMELMLLCEVALDKRKIATRNHRDAKCVHPDLKDAVLLDIGMGDRMDFPVDDLYSYTSDFRIEYCVPNVDQVLMRYLFQFEVFEAGQ